MQALRYSFRRTTGFMNRALMSSSAAPPPPSIGAQQPAAATAARTGGISIQDVIARKNAVSSDFTAMRKETEDLGLGLERATVGDLLFSKRLEDRGHWLWVDAGASVLAAVETMTRANVGALLVMHRTVLDANNDGVVSDEELETANVCKAVAGIVTERDYLRKMIVQNRDAAATTVGEIMTAKSDVRMATTDTPVLEAMRLMTEGRFRHLPVMHGDTKTMAGMLSIGDVTKMVLEEHRAEVHRLRDFVSGAY